VKVDVMEAERGAMKSKDGKISLTERSCIAAHTSFGLGCYGQESVFTEATDAEKSDDGYLVSFIRDETFEQSRLAIHSAKDLSQDALFDVPLDVPYGFHGCFVSEEQRKSASA
jgi:carotenoid cleavage dioxygenase-like enzyme